MRISDWSSDVCSSDLSDLAGATLRTTCAAHVRTPSGSAVGRRGTGAGVVLPRRAQSERRQLRQGTRSRCVPHGALDRRTVSSVRLLARKRRRRCLAAGVGCARQGSEEKTRSSGRRRTGRRQDRKSVVSGKSVSVRVDTGGRRLIKKKKQRESK